MALDLYIVTKKSAPFQRMELLSYDHISSVPVPVFIDIFSYTFLRLYVGQLTIII